VLIVAKPFVIVVISWQTVHDRRDHRGKPFVIVVAPSGVGTDDDDLQTARCHNDVTRSFIDIARARSE
jgi:hypothetical protein